MGANAHSHTAMPGDVQPLSAPVNATFGDWVELIGEQEAVGSNPAIPTVFQIRCRLLEAGLGASSCRLMSVGRGSASAHVGFHQPAGLRSCRIARKCVRLRRPPVSVRRAQGRWAWIW